jgi:hypothetical protein
MHTRTLLASTFLVLLSACSAECSCNANGDDDGEGGAGGSGSATGTGSPTGSGGDAGGAPTGTGGQGGGTGGAGVGGSGAGGDGTGGGVGGGGVGGGDLAGYCAPGCAEAADCCPEGVDGCPGEYPLNYECVEGLCVSSGCASDDQCNAGGALSDWGCFVVDLGGSDYGLCAEACDVDEDCDTAGFDGYTCTGQSDDGTYCVAPPVEVPPCETNDDCALGVCQDDGTCSCTANEDCSQLEGYVCVE